MGKVLRVHGTENPFADWFGRVAFAGVSDLYVQVKVLIPAATLADIAGNGGAFDFVGITGTTPVTNSRGLYFGDGAAEVDTFFTSQGGVATAVADTWAIYDYRVEAGSPATVTIRKDGATVFGPAGQLPNHGNFIRASLSLGSFFDLSNDSGDADFTVYFDDFKVGTSGFGSSDLFSEDFEGVDPLSNFTLVSGDAEADIVDDPAPPEPPECATLDLGRFYEAPPWRLIVTDLEGRTITWLDRLATDINITRNFLTGSSISGRVPSDNPQINILHDGPGTFYDDEPFLEEGTRLVYAFRRDIEITGSNTCQPWVIRAAGLILSVDDSGDADAPSTTFTAWDPWEALRFRPVRLPNGQIPSDQAIADQVTYEAGSTAAEIILDQLIVTDSVDTLNNTPGTHIDVGTGTIEPTAPLTEDFIIQRGKSIGQLLDDLVATGTVEPIFEPVYDPIGRPGITHVLHIYAVAGEFRPEAVFGWDLWPKSLAGINRVRDGRQRQNRIQYFAGQGGPPVPMQTDGNSLTKFGEYFAGQFFPGQESVAIAETLAQRTLDLQAEGLVTYQLSPSSARAPIPLVEYEPGDTVPVYASNRLRAPIEGAAVRVQSIPFVIGDDQLERVNGLLVSQDPESGS